MPYIQVDETRFPLSIGEVTVGTGADARIRVGGGNDAGPGIQAVVQVGPDGSAIIRRQGASAVVRVNGVQIGGEPSPLIHGDKIEVAGAELLFGDDRKAGSTQYIRGLTMPDTGTRAEAAATAVTGGRLVSLVDGREYAVASTGMIIGRDASSDVVVPGNEVSRRHAVIAPGPGGYTVTDSSANGVLVNGERVRHSQRLGRGDILKVGNEEFRFYADVPAPVPEPAAPEPPRVADVGRATAGSAAMAASNVSASHTASSSTPSSSTASSSTGSSSTASSRTSASGAIAPSHTAPSPKLAASSSSSGPPAAGSVASAPRSTSGAVLATLEIINEGLLKGTRFELTSPLVHIGRGPHNEVSVADESVSDSHAKLQRREGVWHVIDVGSTNGTYVAGKRIVGEERIDGSPDLRFGGVKMSFRAGAAGPSGADTGKSTRVIAGVSAKQARQIGAPVPVVGPVAPAPGSSREASGRLPLWFWLAAVLLIVAAIIFFMQGRT